MSDGVSQEVKDQLDLVDDHLNDISEVVGNIHDISVTMGQVMDAQNEQLDRVSGKTDDANIRIKQSNLRVDKIIS